MRADDGGAVWGPAAFDRLLQTTRYRIAIKHLLEFKPIGVTVVQEAGEASTSDLAVLGC